MACECIKCGRLHQPLGNPPWALSHDDLTRLSRQFNTDYRTAQDQRINDWLKRMIADADGTVGTTTKGQDPQYFYGQIGAVEYDVRYFHEGREHKIRVFEDEILPTDGAPADPPKVRTPE